MSQKTVYISGAISGEDYTSVLLRFANAEARLRRKGVTPVSPLKNGLAKSAPYEQHMRKDLQMLLGCDAIYMLRGWECSKGATIEKAVAYSCGMEIIFEK